MQVASAALLVYRQIPSDRPFDRYHLARHPVVLQKCAQTLAILPARGIDRQRLATFGLDPAGDVDTATARVFAGFDTARLAPLDLDLPSLAGQVDRRVHGQSHDCSHLTPNCAKLGRHLSAFGTHGPAGGSPADRTPIEARIKRHTSFTPLRARKAAPAYPVCAHDPAASSNRQRPSCSAVRAPIRYENGARVARSHPLLHAPPLE